MKHVELSRRLSLGSLSVALFAVAAAVALRVRGGSGPLRVDRIVTAKLRSARIGEAATRLRLTDGHGLPDGLAPRAVAYAVPIAAVAALLGLAFVAWRRRDRGAVVLCLLGPVAAVFLTDSVAKPLVDRRMGIHLAYPSGHATGAAAVAVLALVLCHRWTGWRGLGIASPFALALPAVMGVALIRLNWHYPTDVLGGLAMGAATVLALAAALGTRPEPMG